MSELIEKIDQLQVKELKGVLIILDEAISEVVDYERKAEYDPDLSMVSSNADAAFAALLDKLIELKL